MMERQKKRVYRILFTLIMFLIVLVSQHSAMSFMEEGSIGNFLFCMCAYVIIGYDVVWKAARNITHGSLFDEHFLMVIATIGAFIVGQNTEALAVMLFYQIGETFQGYAVSKSRNAISEMLEVCPEYANVESDGTLTQVDPEDVAIGSVIVIKPGEKIPLDGIVIEGQSLINTVALTGESVPRRIQVGDEIFSGCVNNSAMIRVKTTKEFEDSTVAKILELVENAGSKKARVENFITRFAKYYTPFVTISAVLLAIIPPLLFSGSFSEWAFRACIFLVVSCPCALVISVPMGFFGGIGAASKIGVLVKGSNYLEAMAKVDTLVFDKTGTLTKGEFTVKEINAVTMTKEELLEIAAKVESFSVHPIAESVKKAYEGSVELSDCSNAKEVAGQGMIADINGKSVFVGNEKLMRNNNISCPVLECAETVVYIAVDKVYAGYITISDTIKKNVKEAIKEIKQSGIKRTVMLTGDKREMAETVSSTIGIDEVYAQLLPGDKVAQLESILNNQTKEARVAYIGDGINDAPVLTRADVGIAMGAMGADAAIEAADIVLMDDDLRKIASVIRIARKTIRIVKQNILLALSIKAIVLVLGALGFANMWEAVFADVGVSIIAIINSMRTLRSK